MEFLIKKMGINGEGIAYYKRKPVFIEGALIDETVSAHITTDKGKYYIAKLDKIIKRSSKRQRPLCPYFKECGACQIMHMTYREQLAYKCEMVKEAFKKYADIDIKIDDVIENDDIYGYRNSLKLPVSYIDGKLVSGLYKANSNHLLVIDKCLIHDQRLEKVKKNILNVLNKYHYQDVYGLYIRALDDDIQAVIVSDTELSLECIADLKRIEHLASLYLSKRQKKAKEFFGKENKLLFGQKMIAFDMMDLKFAIRPFSFMQLNTKQATKLYQRVIDLLKADDKVIFEGYCGIGVMSLAMAKKAKKVIGVEIVKEAISDAKRNAKDNGIDNVEFILGDSGEELKYRLKKEKIDAIVVDPPRTGLDETMLESIKRSKVKEVVYVSCNPATLAKDIAYLKPYYDIKKVDVLDMFSNSAHVECIIYMRKR